MISKEFAKKMQSLNNEVQELRAKMVKEAESGFKNIVKEIFDTYPTLESFAWVQYTPYFNDGDTCTFSANTDDIYINDNDESESIHDVESLIEDVIDKDNVIKKLTKELENASHYSKDYYKERIKEIESANLDDLKNRLNVVRDITTVLNSMNEDTLQEVFGDHVKVIVTRDGIETEEYEHD